LTNNPQGFNDLPISDLAKANIWRLAAIASFKSARKGKEVKSSASESLSTADFKDIEGKLS